MDHPTTLSHTDLQALCWSLEILSQLSAGNTEILLVPALAGLFNPSNPPSSSQIKSASLLLQALRDPLINPSKPYTPPPISSHAQTLLDRLQPLLQQSSPQPPSTPPTLPQLPHNASLPPNYFLSQKNTTWRLHFKNPSTKKLEFIIQSSHLPFILDQATLHSSQSL